MAREYDVAVPFARVLLGPKTNLYDEPGGHVVRTTGAEIEEHRLLFHAEVWHGIEDAGVVTYVGKEKIIKNFIAPEAEAYTAFQGFIETLVPTVFKQVVELVPVVKPNA